MENVGKWLWDTDNRNDKNSIIIEVVFIKRHHKESEELIHKCGESDTNKGCYTE